MKFAEATILYRKSGQARISCHATPDKTECAPFSKERRMKFVEATILYRKSGQADSRHTFPPGSPLRYSHHKARAGVRPTTPIRRLWFTVPENIFSGQPNPLF
jgi:hypothetical protein